MKTKSVLLLLLAVITLFSLTNIASADTDDNQPSVEDIHSSPTHIDIRDPGQRVTSGYVLTHEHPTQGMAFGGNYAFAGAPGNYHNGIMERGYTANCGGCMGGKCDHGKVKGAFLAAGMGEDMGFHHSFMGPLSKSFSHLRYSTEWIHEAFAPSEAQYQDTNAKIMVAFAVESEAMCEQLYYDNKGNGGPGDDGHGHDGYPCSHGDSKDSLVRQIEAIKSWAAENSEWVQIAYDATQARDIVNNNKLAVILGIESDYSFGAEDRTFDPVDRLNDYYNLGVRTFYIAHKINNRLSGADIYMPKDSMSGKVIRSTQAIAGCLYYDNAIGPFPLIDFYGNNFCANKCGKGGLKGPAITDTCSYKYSDISEANLISYTLDGNTIFDGFHLYPATPGFEGDGGSSFVRDQDGVEVERNNLGLSHDGKRVVRAAMLKGMIVNIDHISSKARGDVYEIATSVFDTYPLNALHNKPNQRLAGTKHNGKGKHFSVHHEYDFDPNEMDYIKNTGGFFGFRMGPIDALDERDNNLYPNITDANWENYGFKKLNCPNTSIESAKILGWLLDYGMHVGYSLDYATTTEGVYSRTFEKCNPPNLGPDVLNRYDGHITEGLSHIGVMSHWHKELENIGMTHEYVDKLKNNGVEEFLVMWETSEAKSASGSQIPRISFEYHPRVEQLQTNGQICTQDHQCQTGRCALGRCADSDQCQTDTDCGSDNYFCGDPVLGKRKCKALLEHGQVCSYANQCASKRCSWKVCADADECRDNADCDESSQFCGNPVSGKRTCKNLFPQSHTCSNDGQCASHRCDLGSCAVADECHTNSDCNINNQFCGEPIRGRRTCKPLLTRGQTCSKGIQCSSGQCKWLKCK